MKYKETIEWTEIEFKKMTDEELIEYGGPYVKAHGDNLRSVNGLPGDEETVLVLSKYGVDVDVFVYFECSGGHDTFNFQNCNIYPDAIAWARMPKGINPKEI